MKNLLLMSLLALSGCSVIDAYMMGKFDNNEYQMITTIRYDAHIAQTTCDDFNKSKENAINLAHEIGVYSFYEGDFSHNDESINASKKLNDMVQELVKRYNTEEKVSTMYCKLKFGGIENGATLMQHVQGNRPR
jgi:hypothetical protein